jgi:glycine/D-amino acid oxidase-like deaminating enzyme
LLGYTPLNASYDIVIVGAGIVGAACAMECARGGLKVAVLERGPVGGGTTGACMGHIVLMDDSDAQFMLMQYSRQLWHDIAPQLPDDVEYDQAGTIWVAADEEEMAEVRRKERFAREHGLPVEVLDGKDVTDAEPNLRPGLAGGLLVPDDAVIYPPCATRFFVEEAHRYGAQVNTGIEVSTLTPDGPVMANGTRITAGISVNACGWWAPALTSGLPIRPRKGHLIITDRYPGFFRHQLVELGYLKSAHSVSSDSVAFNIQPRKNGQALIGSSRQFDVEHCRVEPLILNRMLCRALEYMPALAKFSAIRTWTGHRPATPDKLPLIGPSITNEKLWIASGHEGLGITAALGTGRLLADLILGRSTAIPATPYAPSRFGKGVSLG